MRADRVDREARMRVRETAQDVLVGDRLVERHEVVRIRFELLQAVEVVGHGRPLGAVDAVVPGGVCSAGAGEKRRVGVQHGVVLRVPERAEDCALVVARVLEQGERLVGVGRHDRAIEVAHHVVVRAHEHSVAVATHSTEPEG